MSDQGEQGTQIPNSISILAGSMSYFSNRSLCLISLFELAIQPCPWIPSGFQNVRWLSLG
jgi:hypothetical protein